MRNQPLAKYGIVSDEHCPVDFTLSRDAATGAVTIKYTSPVELPVRFSWTATVGVDGTVTSTPMVIEAPVERLDNKAARALVDAAAAGRSVALTGAQRNEAVALLREHGTKMYSENARLFAKFLVSVVTSGRGSAEKNAQIAADTAKSIRHWRSFGFGDRGVAAFEAAAKDAANNTISGYMAPGEAGKFTDNILNTMIADSNRSVFILNGTTYAQRPANELIPAFKALVPDPRKQKALSAWLNQLCFTSILSPTNHVPFDTGVNGHEIPGFEAIVNRDMTSGLYTSLLLHSYGHDMVHDLTISEDGTTATIVQTHEAELDAPDSARDDANYFGKVTFTQKLVIDLTPDIPVVTDYKLSQTIE